MLSRVHLIATPQTVARQVPLSVRFSGQEHWSGLPFPSPEDLLDPGIKPGQTPALQADSFTTVPSGLYVGIYVLFINPYVCVYIDR